MEVDPTRSIPITSAGRGFAGEVAETVAGFAGPLTFADFRVTYDDGGEAKFSVGARKGGESGSTTIEIFETFYDEQPNVEWFQPPALEKRIFQRFIGPSEEALTEFKKTDFHFGNSSEFFVKESDNPWVPEWQYELGGSANMKRTISHAHATEASMLAEFIIAYGIEQTVDSTLGVYGRAVCFEVRLFNKILTAKLRPLKYSEFQTIQLMGRDHPKQISDGRTKLPNDWPPAKKEAFVTAAAAHDRHRAAEMEHVQRLAKLWVDVKSVRGVA